MKFWVLDLGMFNRDDWHHEAIEWPHEHRHAAHVAVECAGTWDEEGADGTVFEVLVAEDKSGKNALEFRIRANYEVTYTIKGEAQVDIPADGSDES